MTETRQYSIFDKICMRFDKALKAGNNQMQTLQRAYPAKNIPEAELSAHERHHAAGLMRINHVGEVCAQALYKGQAMTARLDDIRDAMQQAAIEEQDHLRWCQQRLDELGSHSSYLNPVWFFGAFSIGFIAGSIGDQWSLGFVAETEHQVVAHLEEHMQKLPASDQKSQAIIKQMAKDEAEHADMAIKAGAAELPIWMKKLMRLQAKIMTTVAYWI